MSAPLHPGYRFATEAQWQACLVAGADRTSTKARKGLIPFSPYGSQGPLVESAGALAPAWSDDAELWWRDGQGRLLKLDHGDPVPRGSIAPAAIGSAQRLAVLAGTLWALTSDAALHGFDIESLTRLFAVETDGLDVVDFAGDGRDGVYALLSAGKGRRIVHVNCAGRIDAVIAVTDLLDASALVYLAQAHRLVLLGSQGTRLHILDPQGVHRSRTILVAALRPCFEISAIGSDGCARLLLAGSDGQAAGGMHRVLVVDAEGSMLGMARVDAAPTGVAAKRSQLVVTTAQGLVRLDEAMVVPQAGEAIRLEALTPLLRSPSRTPQRWQRIEAQVALPPGCSIEISWAQADKPEPRDKGLAIVADASASPGRRLESWRRTLQPRTLVFHGDLEQASGKAGCLTVPLHDVFAEYIWVHVALIAAPGAKLPQLDELSVLYPGPTLIEQLPAIYRAGEHVTGDFLSALTGVLEAGTQQLDRVIGELGRNIHPATAAGDWLDYVAGWLDLPWDEALSLDQKRRVLGSASLIAAGYGTRVGLEALLDALMPASPRRFRIVDATAEFGLASLGGERCEGSTLPAILSGLPRSATELGNRAILGDARLPCDGGENGTAQFLGRIRIDIAADAQERTAWSPWLQTLVDRMVPATVSTKLSWLGRDALAPPERLGEGLIIQGEPLAELDTNAVTGAARLGGRKRTTIPMNMSDDSTLH